MDEIYDKGLLVVIELGGKMAEEFANHELDKLCAITLDWVVLQRGKAVLDVLGVERYTEPRRQLKGKMGGQTWIVDTQARVADKTMECL